MNEERIWRSEAKKEERKREMRGKFWVTPDIKSLAIGVVGQHYN